MVEATSPNPLVALIEEAWRRARRRRLSLVALCLAGAVVGVALYLLIGGRPHGRATARSGSARAETPGLPLSTGRQAAYGQSTLSMWTRNWGLVGMTLYHPRRGMIWELTPRRSLRPVLRTSRPVLSLQTIGRTSAIARLGLYTSIRTNDRGRHWHRAQLLYPASFATPSVGLGFRTHVVADGKGGYVDKTTLLATRNAGRTWSPRPAPCSSTPMLIDLATPNRGWLMCLGPGGAGAQGKLLYRTNDGGRTWQSLVRVLMPGDPRGSDRGHGLRSLGYPQGMSFAPDGFGLMWESRGTLYVTRDGGRHWSSAPKIARPDLDFGEGGAALANGRGFVLLRRGGGLDARLFQTRDYGRTWRMTLGWRSR